MSGESPLQSLALQILRECPAPLGCYCAIGISVINNDMVCIREIHLSTLALLLCPSNTCYIQSPTVQWLVNPKTLNATSWAGSAQGWRLATH